ncbi:MAG: Trk system potassium transporter TrkA [Deltaproteobacteria bacterium]|nr:Trk system potassium transporter TrkA [Deltaproteobacteria bacterium]
MKIIIVGAGEVGFHIARKLSEETQDVVLIDKDPQRVKRVNEHLDVQAFLGSGTSPGVLRDAGIKMVDMLVAATDSDEVNLIACLLAKNLNPYLIKVARVRNEEYLQESRLFEPDMLGIDHIINPMSEMADQIRSLMEIPGASDVIEFVDGRVKLIGVTIGKNSPYVGQKLLSLTQAEGRILVGAILREEQVLIPKGNDVILENDLVYVVVRNDELDQTRHLFNPKAESLKRVFIVGGGRTGTHLARRLDPTGVNTKIIEKDSHQCARLSEILANVIVINGNGTDKELLEEENIRGVDFMVAITGDEEIKYPYLPPGKGPWRQKNHRQSQQVELCAAHDHHRHRHGGQPEALGRESDPPAYPAGENRFRRSAEGGTRRSH